MPEWLCQIITKLLSKNSNDRYKSASEVAELLKACLAHLQQPTVVSLPASLAADPASKPFAFGSGRMAGTVAIAVAVMCGLLGLAAIAVTRGPLKTSPIETHTAPSMTSSPESSSVGFNVDTGMTGNSSRLACSLDGKWIAVANGNPTKNMRTNGSIPSNGWQPQVQIIDATNKKTIASPILSSEAEKEMLAKIKEDLWYEVTALAFSPDGKQLAVGTSIGQVKLFDAMTGKLVTAFDDKTGRLDDPKTPEQWKALPRAMGNITGLAFSPDGKQLAVCGESFADFSWGLDGIFRTGLRAPGLGRLKLWDVETAALQHDLAKDCNYVDAIAFSPDGERLAGAGRWSAKHDLFGQGVIIWNSQTGKGVHQLIRTSANGGIRSIAFSPNSKRLVIGTQRFDDDAAKSTGGVSVVAVESGVVKWLQTVDSWAKPVAFSSDGSHVVVLSGGKSIQVLDADTGETLQGFKSSSKGEKKRWDNLVVVGSDSKLTVSGVNGQGEIFYEGLMKPDPESE